MVMTKGKRRRRPTTQEVVKEQQCVICSLYFQVELLPEHKRLTHKGEIVDDPNPALTTNEKKLSPGAKMRRGGAEGVPFKIPWSREWLEYGYQCQNDQCRHRVKESRRDVPFHQLPLEMTGLCARCGSAMGKMYPAVQLDPPITTSVGPHGLRYDLVAGETVTVPSIVADELRKSMKETRDPHIPRQPGDPIGFYKLASGGLLGGLEQD